MIATWLGYWLLQWNNKARLAGWVWGLNRYFQNFIYDKTKRFLLQTDSKPGCSHIIPKIHKQDIPGKWSFPAVIIQRYHNYLNKRCSAYLIFHATSAALIRGRPLSKHCTRQIYFHYIFIQRHTFYLLPLIFLWTDTKLIVNLELWEKFTCEKAWAFHDNESENISGESIGGAALINFFVPDAALIRVNMVHISQLVDHFL